MSKCKDNTPETALEAKLERQVDRRTMIAEVVGAAVAAAAASSCASSREELFQEFTQQHYKRLTDEDKKAVFARLEQEQQSKLGVRARIDDPPPLDGVEFGYALNLNTCIGCRRCEYACARENNTSRSPEIHYIRVLELPMGSLDVEKAESYHDHETVPADGKFYMPVQCHQCKDPPCVKVCPIEATWQEPDGIVVIDYNWCIGCRYCAAACPYWARRFNFAEPSVPPNEVNPNQGYLSNRMRPKGVMEKCTYCLHRTRKGEYPACLEACPTGTRKFGNLLDPNSEIRKIIETKRVYVLREELATHPRFYYFFG